MRQAGLLLAVMALVACSSGGSTDGGTNTTTDGGTGFHRKIIEVKGTVQYHPVEVAWARAHGYTLPSLDGATFNVEDAIQAQAMNPPLQTATLHATGDGTLANFDVSNVDVTYTTLALVGSVKPAATAQPTANGDTLVFSGYGLGVPPFPMVDTNLQVFVVSEKFVELLASSIPGQTAADLLSAGFVIAQATDPNGLCGSSGVQMSEVYGTGSNARTELITQDTYYFNSDLTALVPMDPMGDGAAITSNSGIFVRVNAGNAASYTMMAPMATYMMGMPQYQTHLNGSRAGTALMVFFKELYPDGGTGGGGLDSIGLSSEGMEPDGGLIENCPSVGNPFGMADGGTSDAGVSDGGTDAGMTDAGSDAGVTDAGSDAGVTDAGVSDAGVSDAGADAGT